MGGITSISYTVIICVCYNKGWLGSEGGIRVRVRARVRARVEDLAHEHSGGDGLYGQARARARARNSITPTLTITLSLSLSLSRICCGQGCNEYCHTRPSQPFLSSVVIAASTAPPSA